MQNNDSGYEYVLKHKKTGDLRSAKAIKINSASVKEIDIVRKLSHLHIIKTYEIFEDKKCFWIISELLTGVDLIEYFTIKGWEKTDQYTEKNIATVIKALLTVLQYLHENNIVFCDLKPEKIFMFQQEGREVIKIIDFSSFIQRINKDKLTSFRGTGLYISPDMIALCYDEKTDIWSTGIIAYFILSGNPPFTGNEKTEIFHAIKNKQILFKTEEWLGVFQIAIEGLKQMFEKESSSRFDANQCLQMNRLNKIDTLIDEELSGGERLFSYSVFK